MLKYEWIYSQLLTQIQAGTLQSGAKLPSIRQLSQQFSCSKSTILTALKNLRISILSMYYRKAATMLLTISYPYNHRKEIT